LSVDSFLLLVLAYFSAMKGITVRKLIWTIVNVGVVILVAGTATAQIPPSADAKGPPGAENPAKSSAPSVRGAEPFRVPGEASGFDKVKTQIHASDEEWKVIGPKLREVMAARRVVEAGLESNPMSGFFFGGGFDPGRPGADRRPPGGFGPPGGGPGFGRDSFDAPGFGPHPADREAAKPQPAGPAPAPGGAAPAASGDAPVAKAEHPGTADIPTGGPPAAKAPGAVPGALPGAAPDPLQRGGPPGFGQNPVTRAMTELQSAAADAKTPPEQLQEKIAAVRSAREKARAVLKAAESNVRQLFTPGQEAVLIGLGYLD
jgi:hypothetical protein